MIKIMLISHGNLCVELLKSAEMIVGEQENVIVRPLDPGMSLETYIEAIDQTLANISNAGEQTLVLVDLYGGTPSNAAAFASRKHPIRCLAGMNLPMVLEALTSRDMLPFDDLFTQLLASGKDGIIDINARISGAAG